MVFVFTDGALTTEKKQVSTIHSKGGVEYGVSKKVAGNHSNMIVNINRTVAITDIYRTYKIGHKRKSNCK